MEYMEVTYTFKKLKNSQLFENLNDAYIISMLRFAPQPIKLLRGNELLCS